MNQLILYDKQLFRAINYTWHNNFFDWLMPWMRNANLWFPLYFGLLLVVVINYKKTGFWWVLFCALTVALSNYISSSIIKENIIRLRPCNDPAIADWVRVLVGYRPQSSSFTSSHAANHFAFAMFWYITLKDALGKWMAIFFFWALLICYAQVYVGVHYPIDVTCGAFIGILIGYLSGKLFNTKFGLS